MRKTSGKIKRVCMMSLLEVGPAIFGGTDGLIAYLRRLKLLATSCNCIR